MEHIQKLRKLILTLGILAGMGMTAYAEPEETLLTTITATGINTYSQSVEGAVTVTLANIRLYDGTYGWLRNGTITVEPVEGYTITKCRFIQNDKDPLDDDLAPFSIVINGDDEEAGPDNRCSVTTSTGQEGGGPMDGVTSIEVYGYAPTVAVTGVSLNKNSTTLTVGGTETLTATVSPDGATDKTVTWSSDNTSVATVDANGKVTAASAGTANITATATNGTDDTSDDKQATCTVTVTAEHPVTVAAKADPNNTGTYYATFYDSTTSYVADCEVYYATANADGRLTLQKAEGNVIKAGEGVILKATGENVTLTKTTTEANYDSLLTGSDRETTVENALVLSHGKNGVWFYKYSGTLGANKAYLAQ